MKKIKILPVIAFSLIWMGCHSQKSISRTSSHEAINPGAEKLKAKLEIATKPSHKDSVVLIFTVINDTDSELKFCKWETPFEPKLGKYFQITDLKGKDAQFRGAMARRVMPPPAAAYIKVPAHEKVRTAINLANTYDFNQGTYTISYTGGGVSGLTKSNNLKVVIR